MKNKVIKALYGAMAAVMFAGVLTPMTVLADGFSGWKEEDGKMYWYENDVKQGYDANNPDYRGKEIFDPGSNAWYWLDNVQGGAKAVSKDVYQESQADDAGNMGKWVRYDAEGHMIKGWNTNESGTYYFDPVYGTMYKGWRNINGVDYRFDDATGILQESTGGVEGNANGWRTIDGVEFWYENGVRQGTEGRGKEIFDPGSNAWYWLDSIDGGKKAVSKDVYQESQADDAGNMGKWVRYDANGHMIKGWDGDYYFDPVYGTMAKGYKTIDGKSYYFDEKTGICQGEIEVNNTLSWHQTEACDYNDNGTIRSYSKYEYDNNGNTVKSLYYQGNKAVTYEENGYTYTDYYYADSKEDMILSSEYSYSYDANGNRTAYNSKSYSTTLIEGTENEYKAYVYSERNYTYKNGVYATYVNTYYDSNGKVTSKTERTYNDNGDEIKEIRYEMNDGELALYSTSISEYDGNGYLVKLTTDYTKEYYTDSVTEYENDAEGNVLRMTQYNDGKKAYVTEYTYNTYDGQKLVVSYETKSEVGGEVMSRVEYNRDASGKLVEMKSYDLSYYNVDAGLRLESRTVYEYNANGSETLEDRYQYNYDADGKATEYLYSSTRTTYENFHNYDYTKTYDHYYGHYKYDENGQVVFNYNGEGELAYSYGYEYVRNEEGRRIEYRSYTSDDKYQKTLDYRTVYNDYSLERANTIGQTQKVDVSTTYDADGTREYYTVDTFTVYEYQY